MDNQLKQGLILLSAANSTALIANYLRNKNDSRLVKEISAIFEVISHLISYTFYADSFIDHFKHAFDADIVAISNSINPISIYSAVPYIGEVMIEDIEETIGQDIDIPLVKYIAPFFLGKIFKVLHESSLTKPIFEVWETVAHISGMLPAAHAVGLMSAVSYNLINIPFLGSYIDNSLDGGLTKIDDWRNNPGGDTLAGNFYRNEILYYWKKLHIPHHFYEEIIAIDNYHTNGSSALLGELKILTGEIY